MPDMSLADTLMSARDMFSLKSPSLLACDQERAEGNLHHIDGIERTPCDPSRREILDPVDPVDPDALRPVFKQVCRQLQRSKGLQEMEFVQGHYLLALDGTGYLSSHQIHCASCLETHHRNGTLTYAHHMLGAALIHPDQHEVIPLMPEPIIKQDGPAKNDCARHAAKRFLTKFRHAYPALKVIVTEDSLSSNAPHIETLQDHDVHDLWGVKEGDHAFLFQQVAQAEQAGRATYYERDDAKKSVRHRLRFVSDMPLNASNTALQVNFLECWETAKGTPQRFSWVTDLRLNKGTVYRLRQGARARWRIENETFNPLQGAIPRSLLRSAQTPLPSATS
jgi:hypothetical protein